MLSCWIALAGLACRGFIGDPGEEGPLAPPAEVELEPANLPRLTASQHRNALVDLFGEPLPATPVEPDTNPFLFTSIGAASTTLSELGVEQIEQAAEGVTSFVFADPARRAELVGCEPASPGDACARGFLERFGRRAFRRPLAAGEIAMWTSVSVDLSGGDPWLGLRLATSGLLQSSSFVYRVELGEPDPEDDTRLRYTGFELASRLSFLLWDSIPDDALLDAAEAGDLHDPVLLEQQVRRLLDSPRAQANTRAFFEEFLDLGKLDGVTRDAELYPSFTPALRDAMRTEITLLVEDLVVRKDADIRDLYSTRHTFVNSELAELYGVDAEGATAITFVPVELPEDGPRAGLLTSAAFLTMNAHEASTSPTLRGKYLRERVLCDEVPPPPPDVSTEIEPDPIEPKTLREMLEQHRENPACRSCHEFVDPPGFLFESFDAIGAFRTEDNGYPVDTSGGLDEVALESARDLAALLETDERVGKCLVKQLYRHAHSRLDASGEEPALVEIEQRFAERGYRFRELLVALVTHESYRFLAEPEMSP